MCYIRPPHSLAEECATRSTILKNTTIHIEQNLSTVKEEFLNKLRKKYETRNKRTQRTELPAVYFEKEKHISAGNEVSNEYSKLKLEILSVERKWLGQLKPEGKVSDEIVRKIERELDLEETRLTMELQSQAAFFLAICFWVCYKSTSQIRSIQYKSSYPLHRTSN